jgi:hypothetical protein
MFTVTHPRRDRHVTSHGAEVSSPLAVYDAHSTDMYGSTDLAAVEAITAGSGYEPVVTRDGRGLAYLGVFEVHDSSLGVYRQVELELLVNRRKVVVSTRNPYAFVSELLNPRHHQWVHKVIIDQTIPIDYGREIQGWDVNPTPQRIAVRRTADDTTFTATDPSGATILAGHLAFDLSPAAQASATSQFAAAGRDWLTPFVTGGGLIQINFVNPDVRKDSPSLLASHMLLRLKSAPVLGIFGAGSELDVNPASDFGAAIARVGFRPVATAQARFRYVVDRGSAPPLLGWEQTPGRFPVHSGLSPLSR